MTEGPHLRVVAYDHPDAQALVEKVQQEYVALYTSDGYEPIAGCGHYADAPMARSFAKGLHGGDTASE